MTVDEALEAQNIGCDSVDLSHLHAALWEVNSRWEIQRIDDDETAGDDYDDRDALAAVVAAASTGDQDALLSLYLDGRPVRDERCFLGERLTCRFRKVKGGDAT